MILLVGCVNLAGEWSGTLDCVTASGNYTAYVEFELEWDEGDYEGDGSILYSLDDNYGTTLEVTFDVDVEQPEQPGPQDLDVDAVSQRCTVSAGGYSYDQPCEGNALDNTDVSWDGANEINLDPDDGDCDGDIRRGD